MASVQSPLGYRSIRRTIRRQAKAVLVANDMRPSTKRGNREFKVALNRLAMQPYDSLDAAAQVGQELGQKIVEFSKAQNKTSLDAGIIRQIVLTREIPTVPKAPQKSARSAQVPVAAPPAKAGKPESEASLTTTLEPEPEAVTTETPFESVALDAKAAEADAVAGSPTVEVTPEVMAPEETAAAEPEAEIAEPEAETIAELEPEPEAEADAQEETAEVEPVAEVEAENASEAEPEIDTLEDEKTTVPEVAEEEPEPESVATEVEATVDDDEVESAKTAPV